MATTTAVKTAQIKCINKQDRPNPHERITHVGGHDESSGRWKITQQAAIDHIERGEWKFWVKPPGFTESVWVVVAVSRYGYKYLKTAADGEDENNLLSLPECP
jgi:Protein of unknown function (DUF3892)